MIGMKYREYKYILFHVTMSFDYFLQLKIISIKKIHSYCIGKNMHKPLSLQLFPAYR